MSENSTEKEGEKQPEKDAGKEGEKQPEKDAGKEGEKQPEKDAKAKVRKKRGKSSEDEERKRKIAEVVRGLLQDGESFLLHKNGEEILVTLPTPRKIKHSPIRSLDPELYGRLLSANRQIMAASGCFTTCFIFILGAGACLALHLNLIHRFLEPQYVDSFRSLWVYFFIMVCCSWLAFWISEFREKLAYKRIRKEVRKAICESGINQHFLIAQIEDDASVEKVNEYLKLYQDTGICSDDPAKNGQNRQ